VANPVVAVNLYPLAPRSGGALRVWNIRPDDACRRRCGTVRSGYPYQVDWLRDREFLDLEVRDGWLVLMNGGLVHGVTGYDRADDGRLLINFFLGSLDERTVIHWV
jgi:hypothetical protein